MWGIGKSLGKLRRDTTGATAIEYALIVALLAMSILLSLTSINGRFGSLWSNLAEKIPARTPS